MKAEYLEMVSPITMNSLGKKVVNKYQRGINNILDDVVFLLL